VQRTGIGPALRKARLLRGKSIEEASRETRIRVEYLKALEGERFDALLGEVYVRGFLRSYSSYLGLDSDKVLTVYNRHFGPPRTTLPEAPEAPPRSPKAHHSLLPSLRGHHMSWPLLLGVAVMLLAVFAAVGWFSPSETAPPQATIPSTQASGPVLPASLTVSILATAPVHVTVVVDGLRKLDATLQTGEGRSFEGEQRISIQLSRGARAVVTVNGHSLGAPGSSKEPFSASYGPADFRRPPTPGPTRSARGSPKPSPSSNGR
jgi:hypothetical protein